MFAIKLVIESMWYFVMFVAGVSHLIFEDNCYPKTLTFFFGVPLLTTEFSEWHYNPTKYFCFLLYIRLGNCVLMVTKLVLEMHALCKKNEKSYVK